MSSEPNYHVKNARMSTSKNFFLLKKKISKEIIVAVFNNSKRPIQNLFKLFNLCSNKLIIDSTKKCSISVYVKHRKILVHFSNISEKIYNYQFKGPDFLLILHPVDAIGAYSLNDCSALNKIYSTFKPPTLHMVNGLAQVDSDKRLLVKKRINCAIFEKFGYNELHQIDTDIDAFELIQTIIFKKKGVKSKNGRRNIQKIFTEKELLKETVVACEKEEKRKQRILNKRKIYN